MVRKLGLAVAAASAAAAGVYFFVYLVRWEWNRALRVGSDLRRRRDPRAGRGADRAG